MSVARRPPGGVGVRPARLRVPLMPSAGFPGGHAATFARDRVGRRGREGGPVGRAANPRSDSVSRPSRDRRAPATMAVQVGDSQWGTRTCTAPPRPGGERAPRVAGWAPGGPGRSASPRTSAALVRPTPRQAVVVPRARAVTEPPAGGPRRSWRAGAGPRRRRSRRRRGSSGRPRSRGAPQPDPDPVAAGVAEGLPVERRGGGARSTRSGPPSTSTHRTRGRSRAGTRRSRRGCRPGSGGRRRSWSP